MSSPFTSVGLLYVVQYLRSVLRALGQSRKDDDDGQAAHEQSGHCGMDDSYVCLLSLMNVSQYPGKERPQFLGRMEARGVAGDQVLDSACKAPSRCPQLHPELHDERASGGQGQLFLGSRYLSWQCGVCFTHCLILLFRHVVSLRIAAVECEASSVKLALGFR